MKIPYIADNYYRQIAESYLKEVYDFIKQCEMYIG